MKLVKESEGKRRRGRRKADERGGRYCASMDSKGLTPGRGSLEHGSSLGARASGDLADPWTLVAMLGMLPLRALLWH